MRSAPRVENTYQLEPSDDERFHSSKAEPIIAQVLQVVVEEIASQIIIKLMLFITRFSFFTFYVIVFLFYETIQRH